MLAQMLAYGILGMLLEVFFTGFHNLFHGQWRAHCQTYLWMWPIYGLAGIGFESVGHALDWPWWAMGIVYTPLIYVVEFVSGWLLVKIVGRCPWDYGESRWTPLGLVNFRYLPFWFVLASAFDPISDHMRKLLDLLASV